VVHHPDVNGNGKLTISYWLKVASVILAAWATMVPIGISMMERTLDGLTTAIKDDGVIEQELQKRLNIIETRQNEVLRRLDNFDQVNREQDARINELERQMATAEAIANTRLHR